MGEAKRRRERGEGPRQIKVQKPSAAALRNGGADIVVEFSTVREPGPDGIVLLACPIVDGKRSDRSYGFTTQLSFELKQEAAKAIVGIMRNQLMPPGAPVAIREVEVESVAGQISEAHAP